MEFREAFIYAMESAGLVNPEYNEDGSLDIEGTIKSYDFVAGSYTHGGGFLSLENVLSALEDSDISCVYEDSFN